MSVPTSPALEAAVAELVKRCRPYFRAEAAIRRLLVLQHEASTGERPEQEVTVFDLDAIRRAREGRGPTPPEAA